MRSYFRQGRNWKKKTVIARHLNIDRKNDNRSIVRFSECHNPKSRTYSGGLRFLNAREEHYLVQLARRVPNVPWRTLLQLDGNCVSENTSRRILHRHHICKRRSKRCPKLTSLNATKRLEFCCFWKGRELELASVCKP